MASVVRLTVADLPDVIDLQRSICAELPEGFLRSKTERELRAYLDGKLGVACGIVERSQLVAISLLGVPSAAHLHQGAPFPLVPPADWPRHACFLENTMVRPEARGRGHHRTLLDERLAHAAYAGMRWVCAGVHLHNGRSWRNLLAKRMRIAGIRFDTGYPLIGLARALGHRALRTDPSDARSVSALDLAQHESALRSGYVGVRLGEEKTVVYERLR